MKKQKPKGFTLIEVIVSVVLLTVGMVIAGGVMSRILKKTFYSSHMTQAVFLAQSTIEILLNDDYDSNDLDPGGHEHPLNPVSASGDTTGIFTVAWSVTNNEPVDNAKLITASVSWQDKEGEIQNVSLTAAKINQIN